MPNLTHHVGRPESPEDPAPAAESGDEAKQPEPDVETGLDAYEVFDPGGVPWRL